MTKQIKLKVATELVNPLNDVIKAFIIFMVMHLYRTYGEGPTNIQLSLRPDDIKSMITAAVVIAGGMFVANVVLSQVRFVSARVEYYKQELQRQH